MPQMDGSIRIGTKIETKEAERELKGLESSITKTADKIASLRSKMDALKDAKIPTQAYKDLEVELSKAEKEMEKMLAQDSKLADVNTKIKNLSQSYADYATKIKEVSETKIPTDQYAALNKEYQKIETQIQKLSERQDRFLAGGGARKDSTFQKLEYDLDNLAERQDDVLGKMKKLEESGKAFTLGTDTEQYKNLTAKYESVNQELEKQKSIHSEIAQKQAESVQKVIELKSQMQKLVNDGKAFTLGSETEKYAQMSTQLEQLVSEEQRLAEIKSNSTRADEQIIGLLERKKQLTQEIADMERAGVGFGYKEYDLAQQELSNINNQLKEHKSILDNIPERLSKVRNYAAGAFGALNSGVKKANTLLDSAFTNIGKSAQKAFGAITDGSRKTNMSLSGGFKTILKYGFGIRSLYVLFNKIRSGIKEGFANFMNYSDDFANSIQSMKNSMSTLSNQIAAAFAPIVQLVIPWLTKLISAISTAMTYVAQFIAILGGKSTFTRAKQVQDGYNKSLGGTAAAAKKAYGALAKFDDLDVLQKQENDAGSGAADAVVDLFEEVPVSDWMKDFANKFKDILSKLFYPLKEAWKREGQFVMDAWKYALNEVWKLIKDIGRDFLIMWQEEATIRIFQDILHIIGDIGLVVGHLARNFREAWNENKTGLNILRNIRDIIGIIVEHIRGAADATVEWADKLDFRPLLKAINRFLESMKPLVDAVWGVLEDFYTKVLLPLSKWVLEKGLPDLLQVFIDFNEKVDWASLRQSLAEFWEHLEPFAETVGEGLIIFIERVSDALAGFLNSQEFKDFLKTVEDWMDSVTPQNVADALESIAKGLIALKVALLGFSAIGAVVGVLTTIKTFLSFFGVGGAGAGAAGNIEATATALGGFVSVLGDFAIASTAAVAAIEPLKGKIFDLAEANGAQAQTVADAKDKYDGFTGTIRLVKDEVQGLLLGMEGLPTTIASSVGAVDALNKAMEAAADGTIYTDAQVEKMRETWGFTADDIEMLRQEMLDANPALRSLADSFPELSTASAESLTQVNAGLQDLYNGTTDIGNELLNLSEKFGPLTDETLAFFDGVADGTIPIGQSIDDVSLSIEDFSTKVNEAGESISNGFSAAAEEIASTAAMIADTAIESGENIGKGVSEGMMKADFTTAAKSLFDAALTAFNAAAGINSPAKNMEPSGEFLTLGIIEGFISMIGAFTEPIMQLLTSISTMFTDGLEMVKYVWSEAWESVSQSAAEIWERIKLFFNETWENIKLTATTIFDAIKTFLSQTWDNIKQKIDTIWNAIKEKISTTIQSVQSTVTSVMNAVQTTWSNAWEALKEKVSSIMNSIKEIIQSAFDWISDMVSSIGEKLGSLGGIGGGLFSGPAASLFKSYSVNVSATPIMDTSNIPHLASGSVIRGGNPFLAMLGDQPHGQTNIEAPLSTIKQAVREELSGLNYGGGLNPTISLNVNGEEFARLTLNDILSEMSRQGYDVEVLGVT